MSYVRSVLQPGETVRHTAKLHWTLYLPGLVICLLAALMLIFRPDPSLHWWGNRTVLVTAWLLLGVGLVLLAHAWFLRWTTEIAVTDRRVIYKRGFISRTTAEMHMEMIGSTHFHPVKAITIAASSTPTLESVSPTTWRNALRVFSE